MKESISWPNPRNPRHTRALFNIDRVAVEKLLSEVRTAAATEHASQIGDARPSLSEEANNLNYVPSEATRALLNSIDAHEILIGIEIGLGPKKTRSSGLNAPYPTDLIRQGDFTDPKSK